MLNRIKPFTIIGTWDAKPKAINSNKLKSKNFVISVDISTTDGLML